MDEEVIPGLYAHVLVLAHAHVYVPGLAHGVRRSGLRCRMARVCNVGTGQVHCLTVRSSEVGRDAKLLREPPH